MTIVLAEVRGNRDIDWLYQLRNRWWGEGRFHQVPQQEQVRNCWCIQSATEDKAVMLYDCQKGETAQSAWDRLRPQVADWFDKREQYAAQWGLA